MVSLFARRLPASASAPASVASPTSPATRTPLPQIGSIGLNRRQATVPLNLSVELNNVILSAPSSWPEVGPSDDDASSFHSTDFGELFFSPPRVPLDRNADAPLGMTPLRHKTSTFTLTSAPGRCLVLRPKASAASLREKAAAAAALCGILGAAEPGEGQAGRRRRA